MTTQTIRKVGQFELISAGLGASGLFAIFDNQTYITTLWDSELRDELEGSTDDEFTMIASELIDDYRAEYLTECDYCGESYESSDALESACGERSYCTSECKSENEFNIADNAKLSQGNIYR